LARAAPAGWRKAIASGPDFGSVAAAMETSRRTAITLGDAAGISPGQANLALGRERGEDPKGK